jgi:hypothetical protein
MADYLPKPFLPKLHAGHAIAGICLIRLEGIRPQWAPSFLGFSSENAAHRIAVEWEDAAGEPREGVFIPRRDTSSRLNHLAGGRLFPGEHHLADFEVTEEGSRLHLYVQSLDGAMSIALRARETDSLPSTSCFGSLAEASSFFERGNVGYSVTKDCCRLDGVRLEIKEWQVRPLEVERIESSFFTGDNNFPKGSVDFDHALIMRDQAHEWHSEPDLRIGRAKS